MPFPMVHLCIAYDIIKTAPRIKKPDDFVLGSIAPDSVHFREGFKHDMKSQTHLVIGCKNLRQHTDNDKHLSNVREFLKQRHDGVSEDFIYGYSAHILADITWNIKFWTPYRIANGAALNSGAPSVLHQEASVVDYELYINNPDSGSIWELLKKGDSYDIPDVVVKSEIDAMRASILNEQYAKSRLDDTLVKKYISLEVVRDTIADEVKRISTELFR